jgi:hypothetical protein
MPLSSVLTTSAVYVFLGSDTSTAWSVLANDAKSVRLDVLYNGLTPATGQLFRGMVMLDTLKLRNAIVETSDVVNVATPIDNDGSATLTSAPPP